MNKLQNIFSILLLLCAAACFSTMANAQTTSFTYQGKLSDNSVAANGSYNMQFALCTQVSGGVCQSLQAVSNVAVANGIFTVNLDFGNAFDGGDKYLQISVAPTGNNNYVALAPRQRITSAPYAIKSLNSGTAETANTANTATDSIQLGGIDSSQYVLTTDPRLNQSPGGSGSYIQNSLALQANASFNISGSGTTGSSFSALAVNSTTGYGIGGNRVLSVGGTNNVSVGVGAGTGNTGNSNSFFGNNAGNQNTGSFNAFFGHNAGEKNTGQQNDFFGDSAGYNNTTGKQNSFFGDSAGFANTTGKSNSFFGSYAGTANTIGDLNSFFGDNAGAANTTATSNAFFGNKAGTANSTGSYNSFFGSNAGAANTTAINNSFFGQAAGFKNTTGQNNTFIGNGTGFDNTTGGNNVFVGNGAGAGNTTGSNNTLIGNNTLIYPDLTYATAIGAGAGVSDSNTIVLGRGNGSDTVLASGPLVIGNLGVGGITPLCRNGQNRVSTCLPGNALQKDARENAAAFTALTDQNTRIQKQLEQQQVLIEGLRKIVCSQNAQADVCKEDK